MAVSRDVVRAHSPVQTQPSSQYPTKDLELLSKIRNELWNKTRNAANDIRIIRNDLDEMVGYRCRHYQEWRVIREVNNMSFEESWSESSHPLS